MDAGSKGAYTVDFPTTLYVKSPYQDDALGGCAIFAGEGNGFREVVRLSADLLAMGSKQGEAKDPQVNQFRVDAEAADQIGKATRFYMNCLYGQNRLNYWLEKDRGIQNVLREFIVQHGLQSETDTVSNDQTVEGTKAYLINTDRSGFFGVISPWYVRDQLLERCRINDQAGTLTMGLGRVVPNFFNTQGKVSFSVFESDAVYRRVESGSVSGLTLSCLRGGSSETYPLELAGSGLKLDRGYMEFSAQ